MRSGGLLPENSERAEEDDGRRCCICICICCCCCCCDLGVEEEGELKGTLVREPKMEDVDEGKVVESGAERREGTVSA